MPGQALLPLCRASWLGKCSGLNSLYCSLIYSKMRMKILTQELERILNESKSSQSFLSMCLVYRFYNKWPFFFSICSVLPGKDMQRFKPWVGLEKSLHAAVNMICRFSLRSRAVLLTPTHQVTYTSLDVFGVFL